MGRIEFGDLDIMVADAPPDAINAIAKGIGGTVLRTSQFSTGRLEFDGVDFDLTIARSETYRRPGALPDIAPGSLSDDLARRDFSINAMAVDLSPDAWGDLIDPYNGQTDLEDAVLRTLHERSFHDDATRIIRAARYAARFEFALDESSREQLRDALVHLRAISPARFRNDLQRAFDEPDAPTILGLLDEWGVFAEYLPGTKFEPKWWEDLPEKPDRRRRVAFALFAISGIDEPRPSLEARLALDAETAAVVRSALAMQVELPDLDADGLRPSELVKALDRHHPDAIAAHAMATDGVNLSARLSIYLDTYRWVRQSLDGHEVIAIGVPQGPYVGQVLARLRDARLDGELDSREEEVALVRRAVSRQEFFDPEV
jgi:tRNA nucleotidyltransferase (CCA-adding enzyme)